MLKALSKISIIFFVFILIGCQNPIFNQSTGQSQKNNYLTQNEQLKVEESFAKTKYVPPEGKTLLIIGQDLKSCWDYVQSGYFPEPGGITTYISLYDLINGTAYYPYGGLGEDIYGNTVNDVDWGSGPLNAHNAAFGYTNSTLVIGLYMTEEFFPGGLSAIANGTYNEQIDRLGTFIESVGKPVYVRIGYEFDGTWNTGYDNCENFKNAYINIVTRIRNKTDNFVSVWQSCTSPIDDILEGTTENIGDWYPGDDYVDWCGLSWFLPENESRNNSPTQKQLADEMLNFARNHNKPVMIAESAPQGYDLSVLTKSNISYVWDGTAGENTQTKTADEIWNEWFVPYFNYIYSNNDVIKAVAYINCNWDSQAKWAPPYAEGYWGDSRIESNAVIKNNWTAEINNSIWLHGSSNLFSILDGNVVSSSSSSSDSSSSDSSISSSSSSASTSSNVDITYNIINDWGSGFTADVVITNNSGSLINDWEVTWTFSGNQNIINIWNAVLTQSGQYVKVTSVDYNREIPDNSYVSFGFQASYSGSNEVPTDIAINEISISSSSTSSSTSSSSSNSSSTSSSTSSSSSSTSSSSSNSISVGPKEPVINETLIMIGQTFLDEYNSYISGTGTAPAGSSHYGELYTGLINQGTDENNHAFLDWIGNNYPKAYVTLAMSIKDNTRAGGYGSLDPNASDYSANACYRALIDVTNGVWDSEIDKYAQTLKSYPDINFLLRIGYEVSMGLFANSSQRDWLDILIQYSSQGINILENPDLAPEIDLNAYKNAFNYIANRIKNINGASNVQFVYHPVRGYSDTTALYPGDQYVDYIGFSVFNHDLCINTLEADGSIVENGDDVLDSNLKKSIEWAKTKKPVMIPESAFQTPSGGQTADNFIIYLDRLFNLIETYDIRALTYINSDWTSHYWSLPWGDSRIESNQTVKDYWLSRTRSSRYINY